MVLRKSIQRLSAADRERAVLREDDVMFMVVSSSCVGGYTRSNTLNDVLLTLTSMSL